MIFPIDDEQLKERIFGILEIMMSDTTNARIQLPDTRYVRIDQRGKDKINSQKYFTESAIRRLKEKSNLDK